MLSILWCSSTHQSCLDIVFFFEDDFSFEQAKSEIFVFDRMKQQRNITRFHIYLFNH